MVKKFLTVIDVRVEKSKEKKLARRTNFETTL